VGRAGRAAAAEPAGRAEQLARRHAAGRLGRRQPLAARAHHPVARQQPPVRRAAGRLGRRLAQPLVRPPPLRPTLTRACSPAGPGRAARLSADPAPDSERVRPRGPRRRLEPSRRVRLEASRRVRGAQAAEPVQQQPVGRAAGRVGRGQRLPAPADPAPGQQLLLRRAAGRVGVGRRVPLHARRAQRHVRPRPPLAAGARRSAGAAAWRL